MSVRRTSGEIVNATLLETFLALVFLVFALAVFAQQQAEQALPQSAADSLRVALATARHSDSARADSVRRVLAANDSLRGVLLSKYPPDCDPGARPAEWMTVTLIGPDRLRATANRGLFGLAAGAQLDLTPEAFAQRFEQARVEGERRKCRYVVRVQDTKGTDKVAYKRALRAVASVFRPKHFLR